MRSLDIKTQGDEALTKFLTRNLSALPFYMVTQ